eukprot:TRINITY_DN43747_c0_g1_i1.p1 TRINITY_DN43747_c0_g1~~TRINITY_DN43747_c0_g1_i1.p1  ORF type:complete len:531 (-),score=104.27 TRINITY_DN43747_c0_g1_i1:47-1639(-)
MGAAPKPIGLMSATVAAAPPAPVSANMPGGPRAPASPRPGHRFRWLVTDIAATPSRSDGVAEKEERAERFAACHLARGIVRGLFSDCGDHKLDEVCKSAQCLACYYLQLFFMFRSLRQEDPKVVAVATAFLACKVVDMPRRMRDVLRTNNQLRVSSGEAELGEEEQRLLREKVIQLESYMLRMIRFEFDLSVRLKPEEIVALAEALLVRVASSAAFQKECANQPAASVANALRPKLLQLAVMFLHDAFMGFSPVLFPPRVLAASALAFAVRYVRREMSFEELARLTEAVDCSLSQAQVTSAIQEIMNVFRAKTSLGEHASGAGPRGAVRAGAAANGASSSASANVSSAGAGSAASARPTDDGAPVRAVGGSTSVHSDGNVSDCANSDLSSRPATKVGAAATGSSGASDRVCIAPALPICVSAQQSGSNDASSGAIAVAVNEDGGIPSGRAPNVPISAGVAVGVASGGVSSTGFASAPTLPVAAMTTNSCAATVAQGSYGPVVDAVRQTKRAHPFARNGDRPAGSKAGCGI